MGITRRRLVAAAGAFLAVLGAAAWAVPPVRRRLFHPLVVRMRGAKTVDQRLAELPAARARVAALCRRAGFESGVPARVTLLGLEDERRLDVYGHTPDGAARLLTTYPVIGASGGLGPKLREGDRQVPEGVYGLESLNPNSRFHVALRVGYPNEFDRRMAERDGRAELGGDIMIHGGSSSVGCLAMGDPAAEDLFGLAAAAGADRVRVILSPVDLRTRPVPPGLDTGWRGELYAAIRAELAALPA